MWDYDWGTPDDFLGQLEMPLYLFNDCITHDQWFQLFPRRGKEKKDKVSGSLRLKFRFVANDTEYADVCKGINDSNAITMSGPLDICGPCANDWWDAKARRVCAFPFFFSPQQMVFWPTLLTTHSLRRVAVALLLSRRRTAVQPRCKV